MGLARKALDAYLLKLNKNPLRTQLITGTMIGYAGDAIAQFLIEKSRKYDFFRGTRMAAFRFFLLTPLENRWMIFAERKFSGRTLINLTKKVSIDQFMIGPILMMCFFTYNEGK